MQSNTQKSIAEDHCPFFEEIDIFRCRIKRANICKDLSIIQSENRKKGKT